ncbi:MAG: hypothetical protein WA517_21570 [Candidatus Acidiferrum sp.]
MSATDFHRVVSIALIVWAALAIALLVAPSKIVELLTRGGIRLSTGAAIVVRVLAVVNLFGAFHILRFGR